MNEEKVLHLDCFSGISGDMFVGAMIDLGVDPSYLERELAKLGLSGDEYTLSFNRALRKGISGVKVDVNLTHDEGHHTHDDHHGHHHHHDHHGDHSHKHHDHHHHEHNHSDHEHHHKDHHHKGHHHDHHGHAHGHGHDHAHTHDHTHDHGDHRNITAIYALIDKAGYNETVTTMAKRIFDIIAVAEAKIHGKTVEEVHFHEVGAVDSIVDVVGAAICLDALKPDLITTTPLAVGTGTIRCAHGIMPVPAPATLEILKGIPIYNNGVRTELVTPTGAAIIKAVAVPVDEMPAMVVEGIGYGLGTKELPVANALRAVLGKKKALK